MQLRYSFSHDYSDIRLPSVREFDWSFNDSLVVGASGRVVTSGALSRLSLRPGCLLRSDGMMTAGSLTYMDQISPWAFRHRSIPDVPSSEVTFRTVAISILYSL